MELKLKILEGSSRHIGQELKIAIPKFLIGRADDCHLRPNSDKISRHHCAIILDSGSATLRDMGSKNGTLVNDQRVIGERVLKTGDILIVGPLTLEVRLTADVKGAKKPKVRSVAEAAARTAETNSFDGEDSVADWLNVDDKDAQSADDTAVVDRNELLASLGLLPQEKQEKEQPKQESKKPAVPEGNSRSAAADALRRFSRGR